MVLLFFLFVQSASIEHKVVGASVVVVVVVIVAGASVELINVDAFVLVVFLIVSVEDIVAGDSFEDIVVVDLRTSDVDLQVIASIKDKIS
jgi:hypothetical protein